VKSHGVNLSITRCSSDDGTNRIQEKVVSLFVTNLSMTGTSRSMVAVAIFGTCFTRMSTAAESFSTTAAAYNVRGGKELSNKEFTRFLLHATVIGSYVDEGACFLAVTDNVHPSEYTAVVAHSPNCSTQKPNEYRVGYIAIWS
jgi:hypothetical protein